MLILLERAIHRRLQGLIYLVTASEKASVYIYALILLPGVFLHELSHYLTALMLGVRTGRFSLVPAVQPDGTLRLGYIEYYQGRIPMPIRESLIGGAPFIYGTVAVWAIGRYIFSVPMLIQQPTVEQFISQLFRIAQTPDFYFWLYLLFAISNSMLPSPSDRQAWPFLLLTLAITAVGVYFLGAGDALMRQFATPLARIFGYLGVAFTLTILVNGVFIVLILLLEAIFGRLLNRRIQYN